MFCTYTFRQNVYERNPVIFHTSIRRHTNQGLFTQSLKKMQNYV